MNSFLTTIDHSKDCACSSECLLKCPICLRISYCHDAVETECCGQLFCNECIQRWRVHDNINRIAPCPMCRKSPFIVYPATRLHHVIESKMKKNRVSETNHRTGTPQQNQTDEVVKNQYDNYVTINAIASEAGISIRVAVLPPSAPNGKYKGEVSDLGKRHGWGKITWNDGRVYKGQWKNGKAEEKGVMRLPGGEVYDGYWKNGKFEGKGVYWWTNGSIYNGYWKNGKFEGKGVYRWPDGEVCEGYWRNGEREGKGVYRLPGGEVFDSYWINGKREGKGVMRLPGGEVYVGDFKNGKAEGKGVLRWPDGQVYDGYWRNGKKKGKGIMRLPSGKVYKGNWRNDKREREVCTIM